MRITLKLIPTVFLAVLFFCGVSFATTITYVANDLADTTTGEDLWQVDYSVSNYDFDTNSGFQIFFEYGLYEKITPFSASSDWDPIAWDPELVFGFPDDGVYDALALVDDASLADVFSVQFIWLGQNNPGSQSFEVYDAMFAVTDFGDTAPVPEPGTFFLFSIGLLGIAHFNRKTKLML